MAASITSESRNWPTQRADATLHSAGGKEKRPIPPSDTIALSQLAKELKVVTPVLYPLVGAGYLIVVKSASRLEATLVSRPPKSMMAWFKAVLVPPRMLPVFPIKSVACGLSIRLKQIRALCQKNKIEPFLDPILGELISADQALKIAALVFEEINPIDSSIASLLQAIGSLTDLRALYSSHKVVLPRIKNEIRRISQMTEPERTFEATAFWKAYRDAELLDEQFEHRKPNCFQKEALLKLSDLMDTVEDVLNGDRPWSTVLKTHTKIRGMWISNKRKYANIKARRMQKVALLSATDSAEQSGVPSACESSEAGR